MDLTNLQNGRIAVLALLALIWGTPVLAGAWSFNWQTALTSRPFPPPDRVCKAFMSSLRTAREKAEPSRDMVDLPAPEEPKKT